MQEPEMEEGWIFNINPMRIGFLVGLHFASVCYGAAFLPDEKTKTPADKTRVPLLLTGGQRREVGGSQRAEGRKVTRRRRDKFM